MIPLALSIVLTLDFVITTESLSSYDDQVSDIVKYSGSENIPTTHSESTRPVHVPVFQVIL